MEVYVAPFNPPSQESGTGESVRGGKWQVSTRGEGAPRWGPDGKALSDQADFGKVFAVEVKVTDTGLEIGEATPLFHTNVPAGTEPFDVSPDGEWFVMNTNAIQRSAPITLIVNWTTELKK